MSDDLHLSQLITKSLRRELSSEESQKVEEHLRENEEAAKFAELSELIQNSVTDLGKNELSHSPGLDPDARQRLKESVAGAIEEKLSLSQAGLIVQQPNEQSAPSPNLSTIDSRNESGQITAHQRQLTSRFNLIRRLGQGGLGNVWLARDERLNRNVALKELRPEALESDKSWNRFHREAEITGHLEHPNVVPLYQYGVNQTTGEPFYTMRFVGKRTLADAIQEYHDRIEAGEAQSICLHRLLSVFLDICQAIAYAHSRGVMHRDLKPENVALDNFGQVIVLDWGLAKVLEDSELATKMSYPTLMNETPLNQTMHGEVVGTPLYMSPEQASGDLDAIDSRTDVYGLGAILFAILTGKAPHSKSVAGSTPTVEAVLKSIAESETPRPSEFVKGVPQVLEKICSKAMARKPHLRYESVQDLATAVESWTAGQSGKQAAYETLRMEGRELRADLQSSVLNLERNVRFATSLPPIEELIKAKTDEDKLIWRERLSTIFQGILRANPDYQTITYSSIQADQFSELVRVERHSTDSSSIRVVPKSRMQSGKANDYVTNVVTKKPGEVYTSLVFDPTCDLGNGCDDSVGLIASVPVYDPATEDVFGFVLINCDIDRMLRQQMNRRVTAGELVVASDEFDVMLHNKSGQLIEGSLSKKVDDLAPYFLPAIEALQTETDFIDETDSDIFGARLWFVPGQLGIMYLLKRN